jgi:hypothetical protein
MVGVWGALLGALVLLARSEPASARDLQGRVGLGYNAQFANSWVDTRTPGVSLKYALSRDIAAEAIVGMRTAEPTNSVTALKFFKNVFLETNLNFYFVFGAGIVGANTKTGAEFLGGLGAEFFIPGLESLGISFEAGGSLHNLLGTGFSFRTFGASFLDAGMRFYF